MTSNGMVASVKRGDSSDSEEIKTNLGNFAPSWKATPSNITASGTSIKRKLKAEIDNSLDYVSPLTDNASDSGTDLSSDHRKNISGKDSIGKGERLSFKTPLSSSTSSSSLDRGREGRTPPSLSRSTARVDSLASDEASVARLLAEMSGYTIDLSSPKVNIKMNKMSNSESSSDGNSFFNIPLSRTNSSVSVGNVLVSLGRTRSNSAEVFSGGFRMERGEMRPRADSVGQLGIYTPAQRRAKIEKYNEKKKHRVWSKKIKYDVRKNFADSRVRVKGRFVRKDDEANKKKDTDGDDAQRCS